MFLKFTAVNAVLRAVKFLVLNAHGALHRLPSGVMGVSFHEIVKLK